MKILTLKKLFFIFCCFAYAEFIQAQSLFSISPSNVITSTVDCDSSGYFQFYVVNPNVVDISLGWKVKSNTLPMGNTIGSTDGCWDYMLSDWSICMAMIPRVDSVISRLDVPANTSNNSMLLAPFPGKIKGSGTLVIEIFEKNFPSNSKTVTWNITGCSSGKVCAAGIAEAVNNTDFSMYPNPAQDFVNVEITSGYSRNGSIQVYNFVGDKLMEFDGMKNNVQRIDLSGLSAGAYFVKYDNGEGASVKKIFKTK